MSADDQPPELRKPIDISSTPAQRSPGYPSSPAQPSPQTVGYGAPASWPGPRSSRRWLLWVALVIAVVVICASLIVVLLVLA